MPHSKRSPFRRTTLISLLLALLLFSCAEQPVGYIYRPIERDEVFLARLTGDVVSTMYVKMDAAVGYLENASHTSNYQTILPSGWLALSVTDSITGEQYTGYSRNYLDQQFHGLRFDKRPDPNAIRTPSDIEFSYVQIRNFPNSRTTGFYLDVDERMHMMVEYADSRQNPDFVQGWLNMTRAVEFEEEIDIGDGQTDTYSYYVYPLWIVRIENFSINPLDHSGHLIFEGTFPHQDEAGEYQNDHVSGEINIESDGTGRGEMSLYGDPVASINFTGRGS